MEYRVNRRTGDKISVIGIGTSYIHEAGEEERDKLLTMAYENGINYADLAAGHGKAFEYFGRTLASVRDKMIYQIHFGADYSKGAYGRSYKLDSVKRALEWQLKTLKTDYINYGFIHCVDGDGPLNEFLDNKVLDYILTLKKQGVVRHIGFSTHTPETAEKILDIADPDMMMFSLNAAYDYQKGRYANGDGDERSALYRRCEKSGVGISVMKCFAGGQLLDEKRSPFKKAMTVYQCIAYALDKPGVLTVLPGAQSSREMQTLLDFTKAGRREKDYSFISSFTPESAIGKCVYCNHCRPCPVGIDVATVNKYYDLALAGDDMAKEHYYALDKKAGDCVGCGHCDSACPFKVKQSDRMKEIKDYFGR